MFSVENNIIKFNGFNIKNPTDEKIISCWGTGCVGLITKIGYVIDKSPILIRTKNEVIKAKYIDTVLEPIDKIEVTNTVFIREQLDVETNESFWICSKKPIESQLVWINIQTENNKKIKICPFTYKYIKE